MKKIMLAGMFGLGMTGFAMADTICNPLKDYVNVRGGPSAIDYIVTDKLSNGHRVVQVNQTTNIDGYDWSKIVYNGYKGRMTGWVNTSVICD